MHIQRNVTSNVGMSKGGATVDVADTVERRHILHLNTDVDAVADINSNINVNNNNINDACRR